MSFSTTKKYISVLCAVLMVSVIFQNVLANTQVDTNYDEYAYGGGLHKVWREEVNGTYQIFYANNINGNNTGVGHNGTLVTSSPVNISYPQLAIDNVTGICYVLWVIEGATDDELRYCGSDDFENWTDAMYGGVMPSVVGDPTLDMEANDFTLYVTWKQGGALTIIPDLDGDFVSDFEDWDVLIYNVVGDEEFSTDVVTVDEALGVSVAIDYNGTSIQKPSITQAVCKPLAASTGTYFNISIVSNESFTAVIKIKYDNATLPANTTEQYFRMYWLNDDDWVILKSMSVGENTGIDLIHSFVWGKTTHFSSFTIADSSTIDSDGDGLSDAEEINAGGSPDAIITTFSDGSSTKDLIFTGPGQQVVYVDIPSSETSILRANFGTLSIEGIGDLATPDYLIENEAYNSQKPLIYLDDNDHIHVFWFDDRIGYNIIYTKVSSDNGHTWSVDQPLIALQYSPITFDVAGDGPYIGLVWGDANEKCYIIESSDFGSSWHAPDILQVDQDYPASDPSIDWEGDTAYIVYRAKPGLHPFPIPPMFNGITLRTKSFGSSWETENLFMTLMPGYPKIAVDEEDIHVAFTDHWTTGDGIYYTNRLGVHGVWSTPEIIATYDINGFTFTSDSFDFVAGDDIVYLLWQNYDDVSNNYDLVYMDGLDRGTDWSNPIRKATDTNTDSLNPKLTIGPFDKLHLVYQENLVPDTTVRYLTIDAIGSIITPKELSVVGGSFEYPYGAVDSYGNFLLVCQEFKDDDYDIIISDFSYPYSPFLDLGDDQDIDWSYPGAFMRYETIPDFSAELNRYLKDNTVEGLITVPFVFGTEGKGTLRLSDILIDIYVVVTDPVNWDTDGDGLGDGDEHYGTLNVNYGNQPTSPVDPDSDGDMISDYDEIFGTYHGYFSDPNNPDTDYDGIGDGIEVNVLSITDSEITTFSDGDLVKEIIFTEAGSALVSFEIPVYADAMEYLTEASFQLTGKSYIETNRIGYNHKLAMNDHQVLWADNRDVNGFDIYSFDFLTGTEIPVVTGVEDQVEPAIFEDTIVWTEYSGGLGDIYLYQPGPGITRLTDNNAVLIDDFDPSVYGDYIVWTREENNQLDVIVFEISTSTETTLLVDNPFNQFEPCIWSDKIIYSDTRNDNIDIYMWDIATSTETQITTDSADQDQPAIYGNKIVWRDNRHGNQDIYSYSIDTSVEIRMTYSDTINEFEPVAFEDKIVWTTYDGSTYKTELYRGEVDPISEEQEDGRLPHIYGKHVAWLSIDGSYSLKIKRLGIPQVESMSVSPLSATMGTSISFNGVGSDWDGSISEYYWESSIDGFLSNAQSFTTDALSVGVHSIRLRLMDDDDLWSEWMDSTLTVHFGADTVESEIMADGTLWTGNAWIWTTVLCTQSSFSVEFFSNGSLIQSSILENGNSISYYGWCTLILIDDFITGDSGHLCLYGYPIGALEGTTNIHNDAEYPIYASNEDRMLSLRVDRVSGKSTVNVYDAGGILLHTELLRDYNSDSSNLVAEYYGLAAKVTIKGERTMYVDRTTYSISWDMPWDTNTVLSGSKAIYNDAEYPIYASNEDRMLSLRVDRVSGKSTVNVYDAGGILLHTELLRDYNSDSSNLVAEYYGLAAKVTIKGERTMYVDETTYSISWDMPWDTNTVLSGSKAIYNDAEYPIYASNEDRMLSLRVDRVSGKSTVNVYDAGGVLLQEYIVDSSNLVAEYYGLAAKVTIKGERTMYVDRTTYSISWNPLGYPIPKIDTISPNPVIHGALVHFEGLGISEDSTIEAFQWSSNRKGIISTESIFDWAPTEVGEHLIHFSVMDDSSGAPLWSSETWTRLMVTNTPPISVISSPIDGNTYLIGEPISFDASLSEDPEPDTLTFSWEFGDEVTGNGAVTSHSYSSSGVFDIQLSVSDGYTVSRTTIQIIIFNTLPIADITLPTTGQTFILGAPIAFDASLSSDADGHSITYSWDFGDGNMASGVIVTHIFGEPGDFIVTLTVSDGSSSSESSITVHIRETLSLDVVSSQAIPSIERYEQEFKYCEWLSIDILDDGIRDWRHRNELMTTLNVDMFRVLNLHLTSHHNETGIVTITLEIYSNSPGRLIISNLYLQELILVLDSTFHDSDGDGLNDGGEAFVWGTNPDDWDTDNDGLSDGQEIFGWPDAADSSTILNSDPLMRDTDGDLLIDFTEYAYNTLPRNQDSDGDGLRDGDELWNVWGYIGDNAWAIDYDSDLSINNLRDDDSDGDGLWDGYNIWVNGVYHLGEQSYGTYPHTPYSDFDLLTDYQEVNFYNTDPKDDDSDNDGLTDSDELDYWRYWWDYYGWQINWDSDPIDNNLLDPDSDNDGYSDGDEINIFGTWPNDPNSHPMDYDGDGIYDDVDIDDDADGLSDDDEAVLGTNSLNPDSDFDGLKDGWDDLDNDLQWDIDEPMGEIGDKNQNYDGGYNTEPLDENTDDDGIDDYEEVLYWSIFGEDGWRTNFDGDSEGNNLRDPDSDDDTLTDGDELYIYTTDPYDNDSDIDGLTDDYELNTWYTLYNWDVEENWNFENGKENWWYDYGTPGSHKWEISSSTYHSSTHSWHAGGWDGYYNYLYTPEITLAGQDITFSFWYKLTRTQPIGGIAYLDFYQTAANQKTIENMFQEESSWTQVSYDLSHLRLYDTSLAGETGSFEFYFYSYQTGDNWNIDDINIKGKTDPLNSDTDSDGLLDGDETALGANPLLRDTDDDTLLDSWDIDPSEDDVAPWVFGWESIDYRRELDIIVWDTVPFEFTIEQMWETDHMDYIEVDLLISQYDKYSYHIEFDPLTPRDDWLLDYVDTYVIIITDYYGNFYELNVKLGPDESGNSGDPSLETSTGFVAGVGAYSFRGVNGWIERSFEINVWEYIPEYTPGIISRISGISLTALTSLVIYGSAEVTGYLPSGAAATEVIPYIVAGYTTVIETITVGQAVYPLLEGYTQLIGDTLTGFGWSLISASFPGITTNFIAEILTNGIEFTNYIYELFIFEKIIEGVVFKYTLWTMAGLILSLEVVEIFEDLYGNGLPFPEDFKKNVEWDHSNFPEYLPNPDWLYAWEVIRQILKNPDEVWFDQNKDHGEKRFVIGKGYCWDPSKYVVILTWKNGIPFTLLPGVDYNYIWANCGQGFPIKPFEFNEYPGGLLNPLP